MAVALSSLGGAGWQFFDSNGTPLAGGKLYTYAAGTTTPAAVYTTSAGNVAHSNPIILDSAGRVSSEIWVTTGNLYKFVLTDADDVVLWTKDDIPGIMAAETIDAANIEYDPPFSGGVTSNYTVADKLSQFVSVLDFGAAVDGVTDDTAAFQAAIDTGFDVHLAPGTMVVGVVTMANNDQRIIGSRACVVKRKNGTAGNLITITGASCSLLGFVIDGNRTNQTYVYNVREVLIQGAKTEVRGLRVNNAISHGIGAVGGGLACVIADNEIETAGDFGIFVNDAGGGTDPAYGLCENNTVVEFGIEGAGGGASPSVGIGVRSVLGGWRITGNLVRQITSRTNDQLGIECWTNSNNMVVEGNTVDMIGHGEFGLSVTGYGSVIGNNLVLGTSAYGIEIIDRAVTCTGNIVRSPTGIGIAVNLNSGHSDPGDIISISGNTVENTSLTTGSNGAIVVSGDPGVTPIAVTIGNNTVHGLSHGIVVTELVTGYTITGNTCWNIGSVQAGILPLGIDGTVSGNTIIRVSAAGTGNGGGIIVGNTGNFVANNRIAGNGRIDNAILINADATNCVVSGNFITGSTNAVFSNATAASVVVRDNTANAGYVLQTANRATGNVNTTNDSVTAQLLPLNLGSFTVGTLPAASVATGTTAFVTDASATTFNSIAVGGGSNKVPVTYDGTNWRIG